MRQRRNSGVLTAEKRLSSIAAGTPATVITPVSKHTGPNTWSPALSQVTASDCTINLVMSFTFFLMASPARSQCTVTLEGSTCKYVKLQHTKKAMSTVWQHVLCKHSQHNQIQTQAASGIDDSDVTGHACLWTLVTVKVTKVGSSSGFLGFSGRYLTHTHHHDIDMR